MGMFGLAGKVALVTGASGGIGGGIARALHAGGATVVLSGTRTDALAALSDELVDRNAVLPCDLGNREETGRLPQRAIDAGGSLDILVNNAAITRDGLFMRMGDDDWTRILEVNLLASMRLMKAAIRPMMRQRWGRIINIASVVGITGNAGQANYAASKAGMIAMTKSVAQETASRGVTANCVAPGFIDTAMTEGLPETVVEKSRAAIPAGRFGSTEDVAAAVRYLASDEAAYVTGQTLHVNGGMLMV